MSVTLTTLPNGIRVATDRVLGVHSVTTGVWVATGTRDEAKEINGISHFLEHMAFKGTESRNALEIVKTIEDVGGEINAYTSREVTAYHVRLLKEHLPLAVDLLSDILLRSTFVAEELERERGVIIQEIKQTNDTPDDLVFDHLQQVAFPDQSMGWPTLGPIEVIERLTQQDLKDYMARNYHPERMVICAAGAVHHDEFVELISQAFGHMSPQAQTRVLHPGIYGGGKRHDPRQFEQAHVVLGFPGVPQGHEDYYAAGILANILGGGMSSRLFQKVREERGLAYSVYAFHQPYSDTGLFGVYAGTDPKTAHEALEVMRVELNEVQKSVMEEELKRSQTQFLSALMIAKESTSARCRRLAYHLLNYGRSLTDDEVIHGIKVVDIAKVQAVAQRLFLAPESLACVGTVPGGI